MTQTIDFSRNNLVEISDHVFRLTRNKLKSIKLDYNQISKVGSNAFNPALINIILWNNNLTENSFTDESFSLENRPENRVNLYLQNNL
jgi:serine protease inhibitor